MLARATMGAQWQTVIHAPKGQDLAPVPAAMAAAVGEVDAQLSTCKPGSDLNRLPDAAPGGRLDLPRHLVAVLARGVQIGEQSGRAFVTGPGDAIADWGLWPGAGDPGRRSGPRA